MKTGAEQDMRVAVSKRILRFEPLCSAQQTHILLVNSCGYLRMK